jgi:hypothetical protein
MAIRVKIVEGAINFPQSTAPIGRQSVDTQDPDRTELAEDEALDEKKKKKKGKKDRCYRIAKRKYDVFPSAYASGAIVKCRQGKIWKGLKEGGGEGQDGYIIEIEFDKSLDEKKKKKKRKKAGTESSKESSLRDWFGRKGAKGKKGGWVDCNAPDGKGGYKACGREEGEKRKKYPACRPTPGACKERGKGKSWGKKAKKGKKG